MHFRVLGPLEVHDGGRRVPVGGGKERAVLALLLLHADQMVPLERLVDALWGEEPPETARKALQVYVSRLRRSLGNERIRTAGGGYVLELAGDELDLRTFERLLEDGRRRRAAGDPAAAVAVLREALALWHGPPLGDVTREPFAATEAARLEELRLKALEELADAELRLGSGPDLVAELEALVSAHPFRERLRGQLMLSLYRAGRQADALTLYQRTRRLFVDELGIEPSPSLQRLERAVLRQEPELEGLAGLVESLTNSDALAAAVAPAGEDVSPPADGRGGPVLDASPARRRRAEPTVGGMPRCPSCGRDSPDDAKFCASCGAALGLGLRRQERKTVTVLFCDLVGFTSRAERMDPEDVQAVLAPYHAHVRAELERFGGTVEKFIGDAVVAVFGAPVAREDDPERAVRAALAVGGWAREQQHIEVRIAVNTGEALVALEADPGRGEAMVAGDVVNTAARLQAAAPVNGVLAGETTYRATRDRVHYREAAAVAAKGKSKPVAVWEALQARARVEVERSAATPFVGRRRELEALREALARTEELREPQLVTLVGVPGIGKSRLVYELFRSVEQRPELVYWRRGRSLPYGEGVSFWALGEVVKAQAGILETDSAGTAEAKLHETVAGMLGDDRDAVWIERHLRPLAGAGADGAARGDAREEAFGAWRRFLEALAEQRPLVLVLEDLHWADEGMLDFVDHLLDWASDVPLLVVATARTELLERRPSWGGGKANALTLSLAPLSQTETARLVQGLPGRSVLPAELLKAVLERAGGNPLYAEEFVRLAEEGRDEVELPESVQGIIAARLDLLEAEDKGLLQDASVAGRTFWAGELAAIGGHDVRGVERALHRLARLELVQRERRSRVAGETQYSFRHALVREVAYAQIPRAERAEKHRRAAAWIESLGQQAGHAEQLAAHYAAALELSRAAGLAADDLAPQAREAFRAAGERALSLHAFGTAARHYERALELWPEDDGRPQLLLRYGEALAGAEAPQAESVLAQACERLRTAGDVDAAARAEGALGVLLYEVGEGARALEHVERAVELVRERPPSRGKAEVLVRAGRFRTWTSGPRDATGLLREALVIAQELGDEELQARALHYLGTARAMLGEPEGIADVERSLELLSDPLERLRIYNNLRGWHSLHGDVARARAYAEEGLRLAERVGHARSLRLFSQLEAYRLFSAGRWDEAMTRLDRSPQVKHFLNERSETLRVLVAIGRGEAGDALEGARAAVELARATGRPDNVSAALARWVWALHAAGRSDETRDAMAELERLLTAQDSAGGGMEVYPIVFEELGRAEALAGKLSTWPGGAWVDAARLYTSGELRLAAEAYDRLEAGFAAAYARLRAGERLAEACRHDEARPELERAAEYFRRAGATALLSRTEAALEAAAQETT
jgi:DNA-binding SARP family transcriptional activator/class 3 adenylate cyclase